MSTTPENLKYTDSHEWVREESDAVGRSLRDLALPVEIGMWVIATRRGGDWDLDPGADYVVAAGDALLVKGHEDGVTGHGEAALRFSPEDACPKRLKANAVRSRLVIPANAGIQGWSPVTRGIPGFPRSRE